MQYLRHTCTKTKLFIVYLNVKLTRAPALYPAVSGNPTQGSLLLITNQCKQLENGRRGVAQAQKFLEEYRMSHPLSSATR